ncbi:hypothetical protein GCM10022393_00200 [Aquimarina addita]|uniref:DoxX family protein n=1 Tax=Aquimarina addita TaxID=870485 RepID=A0ABP7X704_9FLAO
MKNKKTEKKSLVRFIWAFPLLVMLLTSIMKLIKAPSLVANFEKLNGIEWMIPFGFLQLTSVILFIIPKTRRIGFFLLCSYLGGIIATRALHDVNHIGIILMVLLWIGMYYEDKEFFIKRK